MIESRSKKNSTVAFIFVVYSDTTDSSSGSFENVTLSAFTCKESITNLTGLFNANSAMFSNSKTSNCFFPLSKQLSNTVVANTQSSIFFN